MELPWWFPTIFSTNCLAFSVFCRRKDDFFDVDQTFYRSKSSSFEIAYSILPKKCPWFPA